MSDELAHWLHTHPDLFPRLHRDVPNPTTVPAYMECWFQLAFGRSLHHATAQEEGLQHARVLGDALLSRGPVADAPDVPAGWWTSSWLQRTQKGIEGDKGWLFCSNSHGGGTYLNYWPDSDMPVFQPFACAIGNAAWELGCAQLGEHDPRWIDPKRPVVFPYADPTLGEPILYNPTDLRQDPWEGRVRNTWKAMAGVFTCHVRHDPIDVAFDRIWQLQRVLSCVHASVDIYKMAFLCYALHASMAARYGTAGGGGL